MILLVFLVPVAVYLLWLSHVQRRPRPVFVSGGVDLLCLLLGCSGFLLAGGPVVLSSLNERWRSMWILGETAVLTDLDRFRHLWLSLAAAYVTTITLSVWIAARGAGARTVIYNVDPDDVAESLTGAFEALSLTPARTGDVYAFGLDATGTAAATMDVEAFAAMKNVTLVWRPEDAPLRAAVEAEVKKRLEETGAPDHGVGVWMHLVACAMLVACGVAMIGVMVYRAGYR